jgi:hypothetical protein
MAKTYPQSNGGYLTVNDNGTITTSAQNAASGQMTLNQ